MVSLSSNGFMDLIHSFIGKPVPLWAALIIAVLLLLLPFIIKGLKRSIITIKNIVAVVILAGIVVLLLFIKRLLGV